jgi:hypothetical protein
MMAKRSSDIPGELLERGTSLLKSSADLTQLTDTVRDELLGAARSAAVTAASNQLDSLNTRLQQGSSLLTGDLLSGKDRDRAPASEPDDEDEHEVLDVEASDEDLGEVDSGDQESGEEEEDREPPAPRARKPAASRARKTTSRTSARKSAERKPVSVSRRRSGSDSDEPPVRRTRR